MDHDEIREMFCETVETAIIEAASHESPERIAKRAWTLLHAFGLRVVTSDDT